jgi:hypothetical protein
LGEPENEFDLGQSSVARTEEQRNQYLGENSWLRTSLNKRGIKRCGMRSVSSIDLTPLSAT